MNREQINVRSERGRSMKRTLPKRGMALTMSLMLIMATIMVPGDSGTTYASQVNVKQPVVDGDASEWEVIGALQGNASEVEQWKTVKFQDYLCVMYCGTSANQWDFSYAGQIVLHCQYNRELGWPENAATTLSVTKENEGAVVRNSSYGVVENASASITNGANWNTPGPYVVEFAVPLSYFPEGLTGIYLGNDAANTISLADIPEAAIQDEKPEEPEEPIDTEESKDSETPVDTEETEEIVKPGDVPGDSEQNLADYKGIQIDGSFGDWNAVAKVDAKCPNQGHPDCLSKVAAVWDGDWMYLYIEEGEGKSAAGAGTHSNGKYAISSDLGDNVLFQLGWDSSISGVDGAQVSHVGAQWEIAIPKSQFENCKWKDSFQFGLYLSEPFITGITDLQNSSGNSMPVGEMGCDGRYEEWNNLPHVVIEYDTAGTNEFKQDGKAALYSDGDSLYGHVVTEHPDHLKEAGGEFLSAITIKFNVSDPKTKSNGYEFGPRFVMVDAEGNIDWNVKPRHYKPGTYEFYVMSLDAWGNSKNINELTPGDHIYGKMIMTIGENGRDEMEFQLYLADLAEKFGCDQSSLKTIHAKFGRIGGQWVSCAGTSTGPIVGLALSLGVVVAAYGLKKRRKVM